MGFPLGPTLANIYLCNHECSWLKDCLKDIKPAYYKRYVDDIFILFNKPENLQFFSRRHNWKTQQHEIFNWDWNKSVISFLDVIIFQENNNFFTRKNAHSNGGVVGYTLISSVLYHLSTSFVCYTPYWTVALIYLPSFWNSTMNLIDFYRKMHTHKSLLVNTFNNSLITCLFKDHKFLPYVKNKFY